MKKIVFLMAVVLFPLHAQAHPGKTDYRGGHKCLKNCSEWGLRYEEYHLHDKDWNPIRVSAVEPQMPESLQTKSPEPVKQTHVIATTREVADKPEKQTVVNKYDITIFEEGIFTPAQLLLLVLSLLLLLVLILIRRKRGQN